MLRPLAGRELAPPANATRFRFSLRLLPLCFAF
jgi:hypothetical protein